MTDSELIDEADTTTDGSSAVSWTDVGVSHAVYDETTDDSLATVVIEAIAAAADANPLDLEPLYTAIDPDALDAIFAPAAGCERTGTLSFPFGEHVVTVVDGRRISVEPRTAD